MFNAFLKIDGVDSEAIQKGFEGQIELASFSLGASNPTNLGGGGWGAGKVSVSSFNVTKRTDSASPLMFQACCLGKHFPNAKVSICKAGGEQQVFLEYQFDTVYIEDIQWSGGAGDDVPMETVSLAFGKVEMTYKRQNPDGSLGKPIVASYDIGAATA